MKSIVVSTLCFGSLTAILLACSQLVQDDGGSPQARPPQRDAITPSFGNDGQDGVAFLGTSAAGQLCAAGQGAPSRDQQGSFARCYDADGNLVWASFFSAATNSANIEAEAAPIVELTVDTEGNTYVVEQVVPAFGGPFVPDQAFSYLKKYQPSGVLEWSHLLPHTASASYRAGTDEEGNIYLFSYVFGEVPGETSDQFLAKLDPTGQLVWERALEPTAVSYKNAFVVAKDGATYTTDFTGCVTRYDPEGGLDWTRQCSDTGAGEAVNDTLAVADDGRLYYVLYKSVQFGDMYGSVPQLVSLNREGNLRWRKTFRYVGNYETSALATDPEGNIYITGSLTRESMGTPSGGTGSGGVGGGYTTDVFARKYRSSGRLAWKRVYNTPDAFDAATSVAVVGVDDLYLGGYTTGPVDGAYNGGASDAFVTRLGAKGEVIWSR